jgi:ATP-dependent Lon protease
MSSELFNITSELTTNIENLKSTANDLQDIKSLLETLKKGFQDEQKQMALQLKQMEEQLNKKHTESKEAEQPLEYYENKINSATNKEELVAALNLCSKFNTQELRDSESDIPRVLLPLLVKKYFRLMCPDKSFNPLKDWISHFDYYLDTPKDKVYCKD